ncbi:hypothetical protein [Flavobacterium cellulosilyticum]|uniref:Cellobiose phosphorylase n=1 Tax=Flavobacterium cellulosilyticum TaxID=2541731 RepID=A0A4R5C9Y7_9FLAO|nr:hypothetical protein [Flavobacterium cellulosilyticum]TDD95589.1 hypothetical protein E0F76_13670 [Flavobacterium cellulosilyticum]
MSTNQTSFVDDKIDIKDKAVSMDLITVEGEQFYKITNSDSMRPFFMSIVSDSNHWMFISSNGGLSAGRKNAEFALFPYYTDDKINEFADITGSKSIFQIRFDQKELVWEPFTERFNENYNLTRNLYKNVFGNKVIFEEIHNDLQLTFRYQWSSTNLFGFEKKSEIINDSNKPYSITVLDGIQNIMPHGVSSDLQNSTSNLVDGYKRNELHIASGLGIFALSAIIVDKAEPSEALKANVVWSLGIKNPTYLLSSIQLPAFRNGQKVTQETDVRGEKGAYFISNNLFLPPNTSSDWKIIANVNQNQSQVIALCDSIILDKTLENKLFRDIELGKQKLIALNANADGLQFTADKRKDTRHFSNVLFNIMRGGIFDNNYQIEKKDFTSYLLHANKEVCQKNQSFIANLQEIVSFSDLQELLAKEEDADLIRLVAEYLPLKFSRRHGDPSRPWNKFSINTVSEIDGSKILDYQGNWRDIFQNWETLVYSYPQFIEGMIFKFLNATTFDGYNPYRVTKGGFDWETIEPDNEWSYIGYWGDHQIIYLLKFLEFIEKYNPGKLNSYFEKECFVYAAVPYVIKPFEQILQNPKDTIEFDHEWDAKINERKNEIGADGALLKSNDEAIYHVNFIEKIVATVLAKMSNFIPEGGIWMNTQRPEWNDANNALVGNGVSMVTLYYLRRFLKFFQQILDNSDLETIKISNEMVEFYHEVRECLVENQHLLSGKIDDHSRRMILDRLGKAASDYRFQVYNSGFWGKKRTHSMAGLKTFTKVSLDFIDHSIRANQREDKLYHAYNLMSIEKDAVVVSHLSEMLEGQVSVLCSGVISPKDSLQILDALRASALYRPDQNSYILYPNKELPKFLEKNNVPKEKVQQSDLLNKLLEDSNYSIVDRDVKGGYHFNGNFHNANDLRAALKQLKNEVVYSALVEKDSTSILQLFEEVFNHKSFTGRSGTFFAYEGLGSIYWHMVSKLHLAVQEICLKAVNSKEDQEVVNALIAHYEEIGKGIGVHKAPEVYGAFPTDPYSHTPQHRGAQQPGMTGQVKEDVLIRISELGVVLSNGKLQFKPTLLNRNEFLNQNQDVEFIAVDGLKNTISLAKNSLAFTYCQVPVIYKIASENKLIVNYKNGEIDVVDSFELNTIQSKKIFNRTGEIVQITISITEASLR